MVGGYHRCGMRGADNNLIDTSFIPVVDVMYGMTLLVNSKALIGFQGRGFNKSV